MKHSRSRIHQQDMDYFLKQIEKHRHEFFRFVLRSVWDSSQAEDVFSAAVLAAYQSRDRFTEGTNFRAWMFRIIANRCFQANRETARTPESLDDVRVEWEALADEPGYGDVLRDPDGFLENCDDEVLRAFRRLSTAERSCILLRGVEGFSYRQIAETLEIPVGTVMTHLSRGRVKLRRELLEHAKERGIVRPAMHVFPRKETAENDENGRRIS